MKKCAIIIETSKGNIIVPVDNFSKENVTNALGKVIGVDASEIGQSSANTTDGIYTIKKRFDSAREYFTRTYKFFSNEHDTYFVVNYGTFF